MLALALASGVAWYVTAGSDDDASSRELTAADPDDADESTDTAGSTPRDGPAVTTSVSTTPTTTESPATVAPAPTAVEVATTVAPATVPVITTATTAPVATNSLPPTIVTNPPAEPFPGTTVSGDLGVPGMAMSRPACDGQYVTMVGSTVDPAVWAANVTDLLAMHPGASYLRTDQTCPSLRQDVEGNAIYSVYFGPYASRQDACDNLSRGPEGAYVKQLSRDLDPSHIVDC